MKKSSIFLLGALAFAAISCDEAPVVPPMQENPQPELITDGDITGQAAGVLASTSVLSLEDVKETLRLEILTITESEDLPAGSVIGAELQLSASENFATVQSLPVSVLDGVGYVSTADWNAAHIAIFGKSPKEKIAYWRIPLFLTVDGTVCRFGGNDWYLASGTIRETCMDAGFVIYDAYYLLGNAATWDLAQASAYGFSHSSKDVYDDPVFTYVVEVTQDVLDANGGGCYWKIASQKALDTNDWAYVYGPAVNGDDNLSGMLTDVDPGAGMLTEAGKYRMTVNMESMTYDIEKLVRPEFVAVASNANGWNDGGPRLYWSDKDDKPYFCGAAVVNNTDGGFKFIWDGGWFGGSADGTIDAAGGNIPAPKDDARLYWFTVSTDNMVYTITEVEAVGVIGGGDWGTARNLTPSADFRTWEGDVEISGDWKLIFNNNDWSKNYGGAIDAPVFDGPNFNTGDGMMHVTVSFAGNKPVITVTPK